MGRPLNKKFFGNRNIGTTGTTDDGIGGEGVASIAVTGSFSGKTTATPYAVTISAPQIPGGVQAVATITFSSATAGTVTVTEKGSGYTAVPTASCALGGGSGTVTLTPALTLDTGAVGTTTNQENAIVIHANVDGTTAIADIIRQVRARGYKVKTTVDGVGVCTLVADDTPAVGKAYIVATDDNGNTYFVTKLTARKASLYRKTQNGANAWLYANGASVKWALNSTNNCVRIENA